VDQSLVCSAAQRANVPPGKRGRRDPAAIQAVVRGGYDDFRACYESALGRDVGAHGLLSIRFVIEPDGEISSTCLAKVTFQDGDAVDCILAHFRALRFTPANGAVTVVYPIHLEPG
jgi:hypothetical protein